MPWGQRRRRCGQVLSDGRARSTTATWCARSIAIRDGSRGNSNAEMVKVVKPYTPAEIEAVSDYMSQMAPPKP